MAGKLIAENSVVRAFSVPEIVDKILEYAIENADENSSRETVKTCESLSLLWGQLAQEILSSRKWCYIQPKFYSEVDFPVFVNQILWRFKAFFCHLLPPSLTTVLGKKIGFQLQELQLRIANSGSVLLSDCEAFFQILSRYCRKLHTLNISFADRETQLLPASARFSEKRFSPSLSIRTLIVEDLDNPKQLRCIWYVIVNSPELREIKVGTSRLKVVEVILRAVINGPGTLGTLKEICLPSCSFDTGCRTTLDYFRHNNWQLSTLQLRVGEDLFLKDLSSLLSGLRDSLQSLDLYWDKCFYLDDGDNESFYEYFYTARNFLVPISLTKLKKLKIGHIPSTTLALVNALQFKELNSFEFHPWNCEYCELEEENIQEVLYEIELSVESHKLESLTLNTLRDVSLFHLQPTPWSHLKELNINVDSGDVMQTIFEKLQLLEKLQILAVGIAGNSWMNIFTGRRRAKLGLGFRFDLPSIRNLKALKWLKIGGIPAAKLEFTDMIIHHGLRFLQNLQYLGIRNASFTNTATDILKSSLLPFCRLEFFP